ncbi:Uncharacterised protein [Acinetobacter baumannii]|nr:Uncharacterised protein [Acinetobacter baumannii]
MAKITKNRKKNGKSAIALIVVEVTSSRTPSSSRIWEIKLPVDFERSLFLILKAWPNTRSDTRKSARLPIISDKYTRETRKVNSKRAAISTPPAKTHKVGIDWEGTTRSYTCIEKIMVASASTLAISEANIIST